MIPASGSEYCLVRNVPDGSGGSQTEKIPVQGIALSSPGDWATMNMIPLNLVNKPTYCSAAATFQNGDEVQIVAKGSSGSDGYDVTITRSGQTILSQSFFPPSTMADAYLTASADSCQPGMTPDCHALDGYEAFMYVVDEPEGANGVYKLVRVELFMDASQEPVQCNAERPTTAMQERTGDCPLNLAATDAPLHPGSATPVWIARLEWSPIPSAHAAGAPGRGAQTGTGMGYEPPD